MQFVIYALEPSGAKNYIAHWNGEVTAITGTRDIKTATRFNITEVAQIKSKIEKATGFHIDIKFEVV